MHSRTVTQIAAGCKGRRAIYKRDVLRLVIEKNGMDDLFSIARKDRDAWAAIRGYVYQVDTTIIRWLNLGSGETLELECGEDIDLIAPAIIDGKEEAVRTLEQIKCLDRSLTLRSGPS